MSHLYTLSDGQQMHVRWGIRRDMAEVLDIENSSFGFPWIEDEFIRCLRQRNSIMMVGDVGDNVRGFMVYGLEKSRLQLLNFAVHPEWRRKGIGAAFVDKLKGKLSPQRRTRILTEVRETNLAAQLFFRSQGFRAVNVLRDFYEDSSEDAYLFQYRLPSPLRLATVPPENQGRLIDCGEPGEAA